MSELSGKNFEMKKYGPIGILVLIIFGIIIFLPRLEPVPTGEKVNYMGNNETAKADPWRDISIQAKAAVVYDISKNKILFAKNPEAQLPLASLTKIMMALTARDLLPSSMLVTIKKEFISEEGDSGLRVGEEWKLSDIIDLTLVGSSNDGAAAIAGALGAFRGGGDDGKSKLQFIEAMNTKAKALNLSQTYFLNETGLDRSTLVSGGYGSALDIARLFSYAVSAFPGTFEATASKKVTVSSINKISHTASNTNKYVEKIPGLIASKTGFTDLAGGNLVIIFDAGLIRPIAVSVLGSTEEGRFKDIETLSLAAIRSLSSEISLH